MSTSFSAPVLQSTRQQPEVNASRPPKRNRPKNVTWPAREKMLQVRLFVAEDAPAISGAVSQDVLEAKKAKLMHTCSSNYLSTADVEGMTAKRLKLAIEAMVAGIEWKCPEQFSCNPSWLVAAGDKSFEVSVQRHREVRTLEAFYPRISVIPASPLESLEPAVDLENSHAPQIPLVSVEDEEEEAREDSLNTEGKELAVKAHNAGAYKGTLNHSPAAYALPRSMENADPDIAAAAAAAFAVLKAQESGTVIDHDLLIKILSNPLLTEAFKASKPILRNQCKDAPPSVSYEEEDGSGNGFMVKLDPLVKGNHMGVMGPLTLPKRERYEFPEEKALQQGNLMQQPCSLPNGGLFQDRAGKGKGILGHGKGALTSSEQFNSIPGKDIPRKPVSQIPSSVVSANEASKQSLAPMDVHDMKSSKGVGQGVRPITGLNFQSCVEGILEPPNPDVSRKPSAVRNDKPPVVKIKRQCFFHNTPRGCRNGVNCNFLHDAEKNNQPYPIKTSAEGTNTDTEI